MIVMESFSQTRDWKAYLKRVFIHGLWLETHVYTLIVIGNACLYIDCGWEMLFFLVCGSVGFLGSTCFPLLSKHAYHGSQKLLMDCMSHSVPQSRWRKEQICVYLQNEKINSMRPCFPWALFFFFHPARITSIRKHVDTAMSHAIAGDTHSLCWIRAKKETAQYAGSLSEWSMLWRYGTGLTIPMASHGLPWTLA